MHVASLRLRHQTRESAVVDRPSLAEIETPAVIVDHARLLRNIQWAQELAATHGVQIRPHVKTHKCVEIAQLQLARGAVGLTTSKAEEALVFIENRIHSITVAYPLVDQRKLDPLLGAAKRAGTDLRLVVDSSLGVQRLSESAERLGTQVAVFIEIDIGLQRCGVAADGPRLLELAQAIHRAGKLRLIGLLSHAGHAYGAATAAEVKSIAADECEIMNQARTRLESAGFDIREVSIGSTPTVLASETYDGITEIRPGNYVFMDRTPLRLGLVKPEQVALTVLTTVVSKNARFLIIDVGSKVLSSDRGAHATDAFGGYGIAFPLDQEIGASSDLNIVKLSEEHGFVERADSDIAIGAKLRIVPNHACPVVNLADELTIVADGTEIARWRVAARGKVR